MQLSNPYLRDIICVPFDMLIRPDYLEWVFYPSAAYYAHMDAASLLVHCRAVKEISIT